MTKKNTKSRLDFKNNKYFAYFYSNQELIPVESLKDLAKTLLESSDYESLPVEDIDFEFLQVVKTKLNYNHGLVIKEDV